MFDSRQGYTLKRQLRTWTLQIGVAVNYAELYESAQPEVILTVLTHKVMFWTDICHKYFDQFTIVNILSTQSFTRSTFCFYRCLGHLAMLEPERIVGFQVWLKVASCNMFGFYEADDTGIIGRWCEGGTCTIAWLASYSDCTIQRVQQACTVWAIWQQQSSGCHLLHVPSITGLSPSGVCTSVKPPSTEPWGGGSSRPPHISSMSFQVRVCMVRKNPLKSLVCC